MTLNLFLYKLKFLYKFSSGVSGLRVYIYNKIDSRTNKQLYAHDCVH